jgi:hypothetical protein
MQITLIRESYLDKEFGGTELYALLQVLAAACNTMSMGLPRFSITAQLWGFERSQGPKLCDQLSGLLQRTATLTNPDTLEVTLHILDLSDALDERLVRSLVEQLMSFHSENLLVELHIHVRSPNTHEFRKIVLHGEIRPAGFILFSMWPAGEGVFKEELYQYVSWVDEKLLLHRIEEYIAGNANVDCELAQRLFPKRNMRLYGAIVVWFLRYESVSGWLGRLVALLTIFLVSFSLVLGSFLIQESDVNAFTTILILMPVGLVSAFLGYWLFKERMKLIVQCLNRMRAANQWIYAGPNTFSSVDLEAEGQARSDIALRKYARDIEALGLSYADDVKASRIPEGIEAYNRVFLGSNGTSVMGMFLLKNHGSEFRTFKFAFMVKTELENGTRCVTVNDGAGYRQPVPELRLVFRVFRKATHPADLLRKHQHVLQLTLQRQETRIKLVTLQQILESDMNLHEQSRAIMDRRGYFSFMDAVRMTFEKPLTVYLQDEID